MCIFLINSPITIPDTRYSKPRNRLRHSMELDYKLCKGVHIGLNRSIFIGCAFSNAFYIMKYQSEGEIYWSMGYAISNGPYFLFQRNLDVKNGNHEFNAIYYRCDIGTAVPAIEIKINGQIGKKERTKLCPAFWNKANSRFLLKLFEHKKSKENTIKRCQNGIHNSFSMHSYENIEIESNISLF